MSDQPLVSVFMPTYNHENFIADAIESVIEQDYDNLEIVICDDASTDRTAQIIRECAGKYPKEIKAIFNEKNLGITSTCNVTLKHCTGKYIAFSSGDDLFLPGKIRKQVDVMENDESVLLSYHDIELFHSTTNKTICYWNHGPGSTPAMSGNARMVAKEIVSKDTTFMAAQSVMVRREAVPDVGYEERIPMASDWFMWIKILAAAGGGKNVVYLPEVLARYRRHDSNITNTDRMVRYEDMLVTLALTESQFPWLIGAIRKSRSKINYKRGITLIRKGEAKVGRKLLVSSIFDGWFSWQWMRWYLASYIPRLRYAIRRS